MFPTEELIKNLEEIDSMGKQLAESPHLNSPEAVLGLVGKLNISLLSYFKYKAQFTNREM